MKTKSRVACTILSVGLIVALLAGLAVCSNAQNPPVSPTTESSVPPVTASVQPAEELSAEMPLLADNIDGQLTYHPVPLVLYDNGEIAEILVDEYPEPPQQFIYVLTPDHQYTVGLDLAAYEDRSIPTGGSDIQVWYTHDLSDAEMGSITFILTETYTDASQAVFYGEVKFVADCNDGLNLACQMPDPEVFPSIESTEVVLNASAGRANTTTPKYTEWQWTGWHFDIKGCRDYVADPADVDIYNYFYPNFSPHVTSPDILQN